MRTYKLRDDGAVELDPTPDAWVKRQVEPTEQLAIAAGPTWTVDRMPSETAEVSTIFVCFDQGLSSALGLVDAPALVFETMVFLGDSYVRGNEVERKRTASFEEAADAHAEYVRTYLGPHASEGWKDRGVAMKSKLDAVRARDAEPPPADPDAEQEAARLGAALAELERQ